MEVEETFTAVRGRLFGIAYRMLGSVADAEDVLQEAWLRWQRADRAKVRDPAGYLAVTTTRLAIDACTAARARRETYLGPWLPEPVDTSSDPALGAERAAALELAVLTLLEKLSPRERAAYVLREAFDYPYPQIAGILEVAEPNARQLVTRARAGLGRERRSTVDPAEHQRLLAAFLAAAHDGDLRQLEDLFSPDVVTLADGGGVVNAARHPVLGAAKSARFAAGIARRLAAAGMEPVFVNGGPALLVRHLNGQVTLLAIGVTTAGIDQVLVVRNPAKLQAFVPESRNALR